MLIGVIADTHGLLRPEVFEAFRGVEMILHAGDVGPQEILTELATIAPVKAVYGNTDGFPLLSQLPDRETIRVGDVTIFMTHIGGAPAQLRDAYPEIEECQVVIFGHSHRPLEVTVDGILYLNPGAAGPRRFQLPVTVALLTVEQGRVSVELVELV